MPRSPAYVGVRCRSVLLDSDEGGSDIIGPSGGGGRKIKYASMDAARTKSISLRRVATRSRSRSIAGLRSWWKAQEHRLSGTTRTSRNARPECTDHGVHCSGLRAFDQAGARPDLLHLQRRSNRPAREDSLSARLVGRVRLGRLRQVHRAFVWLQLWLQLRPVRQGPRLSAIVRNPYAIRVSYVPALPRT